MMNKNEAVQKLATAGRLSIAHAEDLYDSLFPKPVVPQYVADWIKKCKMFKNFTVSLSFALQPSVWEANSLSGECIEWLMDAENQETYARAWLDGYEIEKEPRYTVKVKGHLGQYLGKYYLNGKELTPQFIRTQYSEGSNFTRTELELTGFGWVFDCPGVEVKEVE